MAGKVCALPAIYTIGRTMKKIILLILSIASFSFAQLDTIANFAIGRISQSYSASDTIWTLTAGNGARFPLTASGDYNIIVWDYSVYGYNYTNAYLNSSAEIVRVTSNSGDTLTVTRAQEGTSAISLNASGHVYYITQTATSKMFADISDSLSALRDSINYCQLPWAYDAGFGASVTRYIIPAYYGVSSTSGDMRYYFDSPATVKSFKITGRPGTSPAQDFTHTFTLRIDGVDTTMTASITVTQAGGTAYQTVTSTGSPIHISAGSWIDIKCVMANNTFIRTSGYILIIL